MVSFIASSFILLNFFAIYISNLSAQSTATKRKTDPNDNFGNTPFFLQDPYDDMCLGPNGFTACSEQTLWVLTRRKGIKTYSLVSLLNPSPYGMCLERKSSFFGIFKSSKVAIGLCSKSGSKKWEFEFTDSKNVKLSSQGQCLVRGKKGYKSSVQVQPCKTRGGKDEGFLPLVYHPTAVHEAGFYLKTADSRCFDGSKFVSCTGTSAKQLLWGVGIKYVWGKANRYFFSYADTYKCLVSRGNNLEKGDCTSGNALKWGLIDGKLSQGNGKMCVARTLDNSAVLARCDEASEYITIEVPTTYTAEDIATMLKNQDKLTAEERAMLQQLLRQQQTSGASSL